MCLREVSSSLVTFQLLWHKLVIRTFLGDGQSHSRASCIHVEYIPNTHGHEMMLVLRDPQVSSISSTWEPHSAFLISSTCTDGSGLASDEQQDLPNSVLLPIQVPIEPIQIVFPIRGLRAGVRTNFVRDEPSLRCLTMIWTTCVEMNVYFWQPWRVLHFALGVSRYGVSCLSITIRKSCNDVHLFCCCHLSRRRALFSKERMGFRVVFYTVTSQYDSIFILLNFGVEPRMIEMTNVQ